MNSFNSSNGSSSSYTYTIEDDIPTLTYRPNSNSSTNTYVSQSSNNSNLKYEENSYIDWNKESLQKNPESLKFSSTTFSSSSSYINISKKWLTVILSAIILGYITAAIDLISITLNDLKKGVCLSKNYNDWSVFNPYLTCPTNDWNNWSNLLFNSISVVGDIFLNFPIYYIFAIAFTAIATYLSINSKIIIKQSGIPEIKILISGFILNYKKILGLKTLIYKIVGLILVVSSGLWLGKEGPLVHVSCCIFNIIFELLSNGGGNRINESIRREILSAATATGISVAFNSPIGGVLFVLESMPSFFNPTKIIWISFVSATIAIIGLTGFNVFTDGGNFIEQDLFQVIFGNFSWLFLEIIPFTLLGFIGGIYGFCFIKLNQFFQNKLIRKKIQNYLSDLLKISYKWGPYLEVGLIVTITTILNFPLEISKLSLSSYLILLFKECSPDNIEDQINSSNFLCSNSKGFISIKLLYILIQGFFLSSYTFGVDLPGGILMPSLVLGATTGRFLGIISQVLQSKFNWESLATCTEKSCLVSPSSYAVIGAASFMTGITKLTMTVVVIMFEMTGAISYVLPIMCGVMTSKFVNDWLSPLNIYDNWLQYNFNQNNDENSLGLINENKGTGLVSFSSLTTTIKSKLPDVTVKSLMVPLEKVKCLCLISQDEPYTQISLIKFMNDDNHEGYPLIVNYSNPIYIGYVKKSEIYNKIQNINNPNQSISFQIQNLSKQILSMQLHYERNLKDYIEVELNIESSIFYTNELSPSILILEQFEKLYLNNLIILDESYEEMKGFIDRFILTNQILKNFNTIMKNTDSDKDDFEFINRDIDNEFDLENGIGGSGNGGSMSNTRVDDNYDEIMNLRYNRKSIELIT
ncbi:GEF2 [Candida pseudojiufengensis]|uniref:GEF2 n=1 Tax=Candida pseudojiufengensis TaxID=497109 RepID=UPI0022251706|nr:GEF2 [Candida pseudojiufengensis]KAI5963188.1 GEF2 [Candida pseudojiufengensis]